MCSEHHGERKNSAVAEQAMFFAIVVWELVVVIVST